MQNPGAKLLASPDGTAGTRRRIANGSLAGIIDLQRRNREMLQVQQLSAFLHACATVPEARALLERSLPRLFPDASGALFEWNPSLSLLEANVQWGSPLSEAVFAAEGCWALRLGQPHRADGAHASLRCPHLASRAVAGSVCAPLTAGGKLGLLSVQAWPGRGRAQSLQMRRFFPRQEFVGAVASHIALALANLRRRESLWTQSVRDPVTGLFNRRYLDQALPREIHRAQRDRSTLAVILCDLDRFKEINDTCGHAAGDALLRAFGELADKSLRFGDIACRYGGDEFVLVLPRASLETAQQRAESLRRTFERMAVQTTPRMAVTVSMGLSSFPQHGLSARALLGAADQALYRAKRGGRNRVGPGRPGLEHAAAVVIPWPKGGAEQFES